MGSQYRDHQPIVAEKACNGNSSGCDLRKVGRHPSHLGGSAGGELDSGWGGLPQSHSLLACVHQQAPCSQGFSVKISQNTSSSYPPGVQCEEQQTHFRVDALCGGDPPGTPSCGNVESCGWKMATVGLRLTAEHWVFLAYLLDTTINHSLHWALLFLFHKSQEYKEG